jgi:hypothetical protein
MDDLEKFFLIDAPQEPDIKDLVKCEPTALVPLGSPGDVEPEV